MLAYQHNTDLALLTTLSRRFALLRRDLKYQRVHKTVVVSKNIEISCDSECVEGLAVPDGVRKSVRRAGGFGKVRFTIPRMSRLEKDAIRHMALSDKTRLQIVHALSVAELCPCLLKKITGTTDSRLSYHLKILEDAGLINVRRSKNWRIYSVTAKGKRSLAWPGP